MKELEEIRGIKIQNIKELEGERQNVKKYGHMILWKFHLCEVLSSIRITNGQYFGDFLILTVMLLYPNTVSDSAMWYMP